MHASVLLGIVRVRAVLSFQVVVDPLASWRIVGYICKHLRWTENPRRHDDINMSNSHMFMMINLISNLDLILSFLKTANYKKNHHQSASQQRRFLRCALCTCIHTMLWIAGFRDLKIISSRYPIIRHSYAYLSRRFCPAFYFFLSVFFHFFILSTFEPSKNESRMDTARIVPYSWHIFSYVRL